MSKPRCASTFRRSSFALIALLVASLWGGVFTWGGLGADSATAAALYAVPTTSVMLPAGGGAQLQVRGMAMQPGSTIPAAPVALSAQPVPPDNVRAALYYGINWGYTETDPQQAVLAVWYAQDGTWHGDQHSTAEQIHSAAASSTGAPSWSPNGRSALQLASSGQIRLGEVTFTPSAQSASMGSGTLSLTNTSDQEISVYLPYGTIFGSGPASVLVWAVGEGAQVGPSATPEATQPQPTDTVGPAVNTPSETATATASAAVPASKKAPGTATPTPAAVQEASPTQQAPASKKAPDAATSTQAPTDTPTPYPTDTATQEPTATSTSTVAPTVATGPAKAAAANESMAADRAAGAPATEGDATQNATTNNVAPAAKKAPDSNQNNVQSPASADNTNAGAQAPAVGNKAPDKNAEQSAPAPAIAANQGSKTEALAPVVTLTTIPRPVRTASGAAGNEAALPPAVQTSGATPSIPAVQTSNPTVPPGSTRVPTARPTSVRTGTPSTSPTGETGPATPTAPDGTADSSATAESTPEGLPTEEVPVPTRDASPPEPTRLADIEPTPTPVAPVIVTDPGGTNDDQGGVVVGTDGGDAGTDTSPDVNPRTGRGQSPLPLWLSLSSVILILSGWQLRRLAVGQSANSRRSSR